MVKGNAVKISGTNLSSASPSSINSTATYYVSATSLTTNTLQLVKSDNSSITFTTTPQNFAIRRLVFYYPSNYVNDSGWKGQQVLYRATGNCGSASTTADPANCLVMVDSLVDLPAATATTTNSPFFSALVGSKQATISLNGKLCTPPTIENSCATTVNNKVSVSITAISRATLQ